MKTTKALMIATTLSVGLLAAASANAAMVSEDGGQEVLDTTTNLVWAANANLAATNTFGLSYNVNYGNDSYGNASEIYSNGTMTWSGAQLWIAAMNTADYLGYSDWSLPTTLQPDASCSIQSSGISSGYNCTGSEMGNLFYNDLGGVAGQSITSTHNANYDLFQNVQSYGYWSGTSAVVNNAYAWDFGTSGGIEGYNHKGSTFYILAVRTGQVAAAPLPATAWLFGSGIIGLMGVARRKAA